LNGPDILLLERDMRLLMVVVEDLLVVEDGEEDRGVESSELEVL
jgi:hypothetical protein